MRACSKSCNTSVGPCKVIGARIQSFCQTRGPCPFNGCATVRPMRSPGMDKVLYSYSAQENDRCRGMYMVIGDEGAGASAAASSSSSGKERKVPAVQREEGE